MAKLLAFAALFASAAAMCPGDSPCSGHGSCGSFDRCTCYRNWQGKDCSERVCPYVTSWNELSNDGTEVGHSYTECASKGLCDRKAGECKCFDGFTGVGCRRMACDDDCSGHGTCETIADLWAASAYSEWDTAMSTKCVCDPGYEGVNCASRKCKKGDDPMTLTTADSGSATFQTDHVLTITATSCASGESFALEYTDWRGETWKTWALDAYSGTAIAVEEALLALPNEAIPSISVAGSDISSGSGVLTVTFSDPLNSGAQSLSVDATTCTDGCQPRIAVGGDTCVVVAVSTAGTEEWNVCSDRGACNGDTGDCECFDGFTGQACEIQTIIT